jgi:hypothetical protein
MSKPYYRVILILLTVACGVCALVTAPIALLTAAMAFDAPDSELSAVGVDRVLRDPVDPAVVRLWCSRQRRSGVRRSAGCSYRSRQGECVGAPLVPVGLGRPRPGLTYTSPSGAQSIYFSIRSERTCSMRTKQSKASTWA